MYLIISPEVNLNCCGNHLNLVELSNHFPLTDLLPKRAKCDNVYMYNQT